MNQLNNLFHNPTVLDEFKQYLGNRTAYKTEGNNYYLNKFQKRPWSQFVLRDGQLVYAPSNLAVIETDEEKERVLNELFESDPNAIGKGATQFYKWVSTKYIGIKRKDVSAYLATKGFHQLSQPISKRTNKPVVSRFPNQMWGIDLIDFNEYIRSNQGWRYMMVVVDIFSRKVFLRKLKQKEAEETAAAFEDLVDELGVSPNYLLSDNGTEWLGEFQSYCKDQDIKQLFTRSYSPEANGVVERMNKELRKITRAFFIRNGNLAWHTLLDAIAGNKNGTFNSSVKNTPDTIWTPTKEEINTARANKEPSAVARRAILKKIKRQIARFQEEDDFEVGEPVRVKMSSIFANVRRLVKEGNTKQIVVSYTPELFLINRVIIPRNRLLERRRYTLENADGELLTKGGSVQQFYASELLHFRGENGASDIDIDMDMALKLNKVERNANDVKY